MNDNNNVMKQYHEIKRMHAALMKNLRDAESEMKLLA